jgi:hypothetical protein
MEQISTKQREERAKGFRINHFGGRLRVEPSKATELRSKGSGKAKSHSRLKMPEIN